MFSENVRYTLPTCHIYVFVNFIQTLVIIFRFSENYSIKIDTQPFNQTRYAHLRTFSKNVFLRFAKITCFQYIPRFFVMFLGILVSPKINHVGVGASGDVQKSRNYENDGFGPLR